MTRRQRVLTGVALVVVVVAAVVAAGVLVGHALGPRPLQPVAGPTGLPDVWRAGQHSFELSDRPIEAASLAVDGGYGVVLAAADGNGYRVHPVDAGVEWFRLSPDGRSLAWRDAADAYGANQPLVRVVRLADGRVTEVRTGDRRTGLVAAEWTPDGRRLLVAGGRGAQPEAVVWDVDVATGRAAVHCTCGDVRPTSAGRLVRWPLDPGALVAPDGRTRALPQNDGMGLDMIDADGVRWPVRLAVNVGEPLAWTPAGIWLVIDISAPQISHSRLVLADPRTGRTRALTDELPQRDVSVAADVAGDGRVVHSEGEPGTVQRLQTVRAWFDNPFVWLALLGGAFWVPVLVVAGLLVVAISQIGRPPPRQSPPPGPPG